ncbi:hypothetical protein HY410_01050 [Candidatus Gottesmanbacteria bacterium]|nr:hypothetical protein [Candidatus Gottesmanbacteria bacterium]
MDKNTQPVHPAGEPVEPQSPVAPLEEPKPRSSAKIFFLVYGIVVLLGIGTGYLLSRSSVGGGAVDDNAGYIKTETVAGITDEKTFKDSAEGTLEKGGINGEGTHKLIREGGESQTAYLVSSVINLDEYAGKKVKVWGETFAAEKASWLMDVGKIEILQ